MAGFSNVEVLGKKLYIDSDNIGCRRITSLMIKAVE
jgi:hypothetical protein